MPGHTEASPAHQGTLSTGSLAQRGLARASLQPMLFLPSPPAFPSSLHRSQTSSAVRRLYLLLFPPPSSLTEISLIHLFHTYSQIDICFSEDPERRTHKVTSHANNKKACLSTYSSNCGQIAPILLRLQMLYTKSSILNKYVKYIKRYSAETGS